MGHVSANSQCASASHNPTAPENITQALDHVISLLDPRMAAAIMAMQLNSIPPGDAAIIQNYFNELFKRKTNTPVANGNPSSTR